MSKAIVITLSATMVVLVVVFLGYQLLERKTDPCEGIFQQTSVSLGTKLDTVKAKGEIVIGRQKIQELTERSQQMALNLKTCCIVLGNASSDFLRCKEGFDKLDAGVGNIATSVQEAEVARQQGNTAVATQKIAEATEGLKAFEASSQEFANQITQIKDKPSAAQASKPVPVSDSEKEPNNDILHANAISLETRVRGAIADGSDVDFFQFTTPPPPRDILQVVVDNASTTLAPGITIFDKDRNEIGGDSRGTGGANLDYTFSALPGTTYYVKVWGRGSTSGAYILSVKQLRKYDRYEPNDDIFHATPVQLGKAMEANIMDRSDVDFYKLQSPGAAGKLTVFLENASTTLAPGITIFDKDRNEIGGDSRGTDGANLDYTFSALPGATYYVKVWGRASTSGAYSLVVKP